MFAKKCNQGNDFIRWKIIKIILLRGIRCWMAEGHNHNFLGNCCNNFVKVYVERNAERPLSSSRISLSSYFLFDEWVGEHLFRVIYIYIYSFILMCFHLEIGYDEGKWNRWIFNFSNILFEFISLSVTPIWLQAQSTPETPQIENFLEKKKDIYLHTTNKLILHPHYCAAYRTESNYSDFIIHDPS